MEIVGPQTTVAKPKQLPLDPDAAQLELLRLAVLLHVVVQVCEVIQRLCNLQKDDEDSEQLCSNFHPVVFRSTKRFTDLDRLEMHALGLLVHLICSDLLVHHILNTENYEKKYEEKLQILRLQLIADHR